MVACIFGLALFRQVAPKHHFGFVIFRDFRANHEKSRSGVGPNGLFAFINQPENMATTTKTTAKQKAAKKRAATKARAARAKKTKGTKPKAAKKKATPKVPAGYVKLTLLVPKSALPKSK
jgi:hypothetical protein